MERVNVGKIECEANKLNTKNKFTERFSNSVYLAG